MTDQHDALCLVALRRIVRRALACGQLEKLEDARPYLGDEPQGAPPDSLRVRICQSLMWHGRPCMLPLGHDGNHENWRDEP